MDDDKGNLPANLRVQLAAKGLTQRELSRRSGVSQTLISQIVNANRARIGTDALRKLAIALDIAPTDLDPNYCPTSHVDRLHAALLTLPAGEQLAAGFMVVVEAVRGGRE